jgi:hypothetical protein
MPLLNLQTDLKSLKYGQDQPGGGSSGQPFITTNVNDPHGTRVNFGSNSILNLVGINSIPLIPNVSSALNRSNIGRLIGGFLNSDDFIRGGAIGSVQASINDAFRIGSFLLSPPKGPIFIAKQIGLQLTNPKLEVKKGLAGVAAGTLAPGGLLGTVTGGVLGPTRIYNLGINTLAQTGVNAFGLHFVRHGLGPVQNDDTKYEAVVTFNNNSPNSIQNRLVELKNKFSLGDNQTNLVLTPRLTRTVNTVLSAFNALAGTNFTPVNYTPAQLTIDKYLTGPGSIYGIGSTIIPRTSFTEDKLQIDRLARLQNTTLRLSQNNVNYYNIQGVSQQYFTPIQIDEFNSIDVARPTAKPSTLDTATYSTTKTSAIALTVTNNVISSQNGTLLNAQVTNTIPVQNATYRRYKQIVDSKKLRERTFTVNGNQVNEFGLYGTNNPDQIVSGIIGREVLPTVTTYPIYSNGDKIVKINIPWNKVTRELRVGSGLQDQINLTPIFNSVSGSLPDKVTIYDPTIQKRIEHNINDLVKFRIQAIAGSNPQSSNYMIFRAYITQFSDNTDAAWSSVKYSGRGEDFYIYNGFSRKIQISFKVAALSAEEMKPMYQKLNYLMSNLMPDYENNLMRGPLVKMTVGNWIDSQVGVLNSISYNVPQDSPWEIALNEPLPGASGVDTKMLILPHIVEVSMTFTPIGSQTKGVNLISEKSEKASHIAQNVNDYQFIGDNIYRENT